MRNVAEKRSVPHFHCEDSRHTVQVLQHKEVGATWNFLIAAVWLQHAGDGGRSPCSKQAVETSLRAEHPVHWLWLSATGHGRGFGRAAQENARPAPDGHEPQPQDCKSPACHQVLVSSAAGLRLYEPGAKRMDSEAHLLCSWPEPESAVDRRHFVAHTAARKASRGQYLWAILPSTWLPAMPTERIVITTCIELAKLRIELGVVP